MTSDLRRLVMAAAAIGAGMAVYRADARADVLVLYSNVPGVQRGDRLEDSKVLDIPAGKMLRILRPAGGTQEVVGPQKRQVRDLTRGERMNEAIWREALDQISKDNQTGGTGGTRGSAGTRGGSR